MPAAFLADTFMLLAEACVSFAERRQMVGVTHMSFRTEVFIYEMTQRLKTLSFLLKSICIAVGFWP